MIIIFVLLWFGALWSMEMDEQHIQPANMPLPVLSLKESALRSVCCYVAEGKIPIDRAKALPTDILNKIKEVGTPILLLNKGTDHYLNQTLTPDHRYILMTVIDFTHSTLFYKVVRLDLSMQASTVVDDIEGIAPSWRLSPSGNLLASRSSPKLRIKDIAQNKVMAEKQEHGLMDVLGFIGEKGCLVKDGNNHIHCVSIKEKLDGYTTNFKYVGTLHHREEFVVYKADCFVRMTVEGNKTKAIKASDFRDYLYIRSALYEPEMLIAYESNERGIIIQSLETAEILSELKRMGNLTALSFAYKGKWLIGANVVERVVKNRKTEERAITIWDWQHKQKLFELPWHSTVYHLSYTDHPTPYPCLLESNYAIHFFDPIKAVAAGMLSQAAVRKAAITSNNNNNDNGSAPITSSKMEIDK